ncbi:MAG: hypothetical protein WBF17_06165, partial [Phycisphaerae bacterium]
GVTAEKTEDEDEDEDEHEHDYGTTSIRNPQFAIRNRSGPTVFRSSSIPVFRSSGLPVFPSDLRPTTYDP